MHSTEVILNRLQQENAVVVTVDAFRGSVPREKGAWMAVFQEQTFGTIGGGRLELDAIAHARGVLEKSQAPGLKIYKLGPSLGQCCGGEVTLQYEICQSTDIDALRQRLCQDRPVLALFGGGHVGQAIVKVLSTLPVDVRWFDSRNEIFPEELAALALCEHSDPVQAAVPTLPPGTRVLIMSFSHAEDLDIVAACLLRQRLQADLPYIGLIGSKTKWASFRQRLEARGFSDGELAHITCPIGIAGIRGKQPEVIAVSVAAQLLQGLPG